MTIMTFGITDAVDYLEKLKWEHAQYLAKLDARAPYNELSYIAVNAMDTAWHVGVWAYATLSVNVRQILLETLGVTEGRDDADRFVGALSYKLRDLRLCRHVAVYYKHHTPRDGVTKGQITVGSALPTSGVATYTTATGSVALRTLGPDNVQAPWRVPKVIDGEARHRVEHVVERLIQFWSAFLNDPVATLQLAIASSPEEPAPPKC